MDEEQVTQEILEATAQLDTADLHVTSPANPLSYFRIRIVPNIENNGFDQSLIQESSVNLEFDEIIKCALHENDFEMLDQLLWLIKDENDEQKRKRLILKYIRVCCYLTNDEINDCVDHLLEYMHDDITSTWSYDVAFLFELLHNCGVNIEKLISLLEYVKILDVLIDVPLNYKLNYDDRTKSNESTNQIINSIKRVFRIVLSLGYFQIKKPNSTLSNDNHLFLCLLGFYLQLDKRFQDMNTIHLARRLMVNGVNLLTPTYWNEKRDLLVECLYTLSLKNVYIVELFLKTNERIVRIRTQLALLHLKRLVNMVEHEKKSEATILEEIINDKLNPRSFKKQTDFIDCVRLLSDIIDSYPHGQQMEYLLKLYKKILPYTRRDHEKLFTDEQHLLLFDDCERWSTMLKPYLNQNDFQK